MRCCCHCFRANAVVTFIEREGTVGNCDYCGAESAKTISAEDLGGLFDPLLALYEPAKDQTASGDESLAVAIGRWSVFRDNLPLEKQNQILDVIRFGPAEAKDRSLAPLSGEKWHLKYANQDEQVWTQFVSHIKSKRRFLLGQDYAQASSNPRDWLSGVLKAAEMMVSPELKFYRAREGWDKQRAGIPSAFSAAQMGAPPAAIASRGRANPAGIAYLYVAEELETAVAEIRPYVGARVSVGTLSTTRRLRIADISKARTVESPFGQADLQSLLRQNGLLNILNRELARPVSPADSEIEYVPTQYLAEVILDLGYDGIRYQSAVRTGGTNVVFFQPENLRIHPHTQLVEVESIEVRFRPLN